MEQKTLFLLDDVFVSYSPIEILRHTDAKS